MKNKLLFLLFIATFNLSAQDYCKERYLADSLYRIQNYAEAVVYYKSLLPEDMKRKDLYKIAVCYRYMQQKDSSVHYFNLAISKGLYYPSGFGLEQDKNLAYLREEPAYKHYLEKLEQNRLQHINVTDSILFRELIAKKIPISFTGIFSPGC